MGLFNKKTPNQTQGEKNLKQTFKKINETLHEEAGFRHSNKIISNVANEIRQELKQNQITPDEVEDRVYTLVEYELGYPLQVNKMVYDIEIPYLSSGIHGYTRVSKGVVMGTNMGEGITQWRTTKLFIHDYGVEIKQTGQQIRFSDIAEVRTGDDGGLLIKNTKLVLFFVNGEQFVMKVRTPDVDGLLGLFNQNISGSSNGDGSNADELLKYADLFERGLITREEFEEVKKRFL